MHINNKIALILGWALTAIGIVITLVFSATAGIVVLLLLASLMLSLQVLQRQQLAKVQARTLLLLDGQKKNLKAVQKNSTVNIERASTEELPIKRLIGLLQAQQVSIEILNDKIERAYPGRTNLSNE